MRPAHFYTSVDKAMKVRSHIIHLPSPPSSFSQQKLHMVTDSFCLLPPHSSSQELDWTPKYGNLEGFIDSYQNDYMVKKAAGTLKPDFECDDM